MNCMSCGGKNISASHHGIFSIFVPLPTKSSIVPKLNMESTADGIRTRPLHLDHCRSNVKPKMIEKNLAIREHTRKSRSVWAADCIHKGPQS